MSKITAEQAAKLLGYKTTGGLNALVHYGKIKKHKDGSYDAASVQAYKASKAESRPAKTKSVKRVSSVTVKRDDFSIQFETGKLAGLLMARDAWTPEVEKQVQRIIAS